MKTCKKKLAGILFAVGMLFAVGTVSTFPAHASVLYGDVNNDTYVNSTDSLDLFKYSKGMYNGNAINLKNADVDKNTVIDVNDQKVLDGALNGTYGPLPYSASGITFNYNSYTLPNDSIRFYKKYDCSTKSITPYTLSVPANTFSVPEIPRSGSVDDRILDSSANAQCIVYLSYRQSDGNYYFGTGFIVDDGVIATCAHNLYDGNAFNTDYKVLVYDATGTGFVMMYSAKELHIPLQYYSDNTNSNFDYGLIYVDADLSGYGKMALGLPTNQFGYTNQAVYVSGFPGYVQGVPQNLPARYVGAGTVTTMIDNKIWYTSYTSDGDSGGPVYMEYTLGNTTFRSAVGIHTGGVDPSHWGTRITVPLLRFYYNNANIG